PTRPRRAGARVRHEPGHDLRVLRDAILRAGARRAGHAPRARRALATEHRLCRWRHLPLRAGGARAHAVAARPAARARRRVSRPAARSLRDGDVVTRATRAFLPVVSRHLANEFLGAFSLTLLAFVAIYLTADFFDRLDSFLSHGAAADAVVRYFLFKIPL